MAWRLTTVFPKLLQLLGKWWAWVISTLISELATPDRLCTECSLEPRFVLDRLNLMNKIFLMLACHAEISDSETSGKSYWMAEVICHSACLLRNISTQLLVHIQLAIALGNWKAETGWEWERKIGMEIYAIWQRQLRTCCYLVHK